MGSRFPCERASLGENVIDTANGWLKKQELCSKVTKYDLYILCYSANFLNAPLVFNKFASSISEIYMQCLSVVTAYLARRRILPAIDLPKDINASLSTQLRIIVHFCSIFTNTRLPQSHFLLSSPFSSNFAKRYAYIRLIGLPPSYLTLIQKDNIITRKAVVRGGTGVTYFSFQFRSAFPPS